MGRWLGPIQLCDYGDDNGRQSSGTQKMAWVQAMWLVIALVVWDCCTIAGFPVTHQSCLVHICLGF